MRVSKLVVSSDGESPNARAKRCVYSSMGEIAHQVCIKDEYELVPARCENISLCDPQNNEHVVLLDT